MKTIWIASALGLALAPAWAQNTPAPTPSPAPPTVPEQLGEGTGTITPTERENITGTVEAQTLSKSDRKNLEELAKMNTSDVALSELAVERASNEEVKQFAKQMVDEHGKTNKEIQDLASKKGITLGATEPKVPPKLSKLSGDKFDREYMKTMVIEHKKVVSKMERVGNTAQDPELRSWAEKTTPTVQQHFEMAKNTEKAIKEKASGTPVTP